MRSSWMLWADEEAVDRRVELLEGSHARAAYRGVAT
jgi:hypothetical protein